MSSKTTVIQLNRQFSSNTVACAAHLSSDALKTNAEPAVKLTTPPEVVTWNWQAQRSTNRHNKNWDNASAGCDFRCKVDCRGLWDERVNVVYMWALCLYRDDSLLCPMTETFFFPFVLNVLNAKKKGEKKKTCMIFTIWFDVRCADTRGLCGVGGDSLQNGGQNSNPGNCVVHIRWNEDTLALTSQHLRTHNSSKKKIDCHGSKVETAGHTIEASRC